MGAIDEIRHVIVLMLENQSFDRLLGFVTLDDPTQKLDGLTGAESNPLAPPHDMTPVPVLRLTAPTAYVTDPGPGHEFEDVNEQLFGDRAASDTKTPTNSGFVLNYSRQKDAQGRRLGDLGRGIMHGLDPALVPVITTLARSFVVCDRWFCSIPGPTWPNRFFLHAATANGLLDTPEVPDQLATEFWNSPYEMRSIFDSLTDKGVPWAVYYDDYAQAFALRRLHRHADRFVKFEQFAHDVEHGTVPAYAFIEPRSFSGPGYPANDQHPPHHLLDGERLIANVYDTIRGNEDLWRRSLLVILYDEHGGFYDHVPPPPAVPPDGRPARSSGFAYDRLGLRVPAILVSPWVGEGRVDHTVYDHTSLLATLKKVFGLPAFLTARDAAANTFEGNLLSAPRRVELTNLTRLLPATPAADSGRELPGLSSHQRSLLALAKTILAPDRARTTSGTPAALQARTFLDQSQAP